MIHIKLLVLVISKSCKKLLRKIRWEKVNKSGEPKSELKDLIAQYLDFNDYTEFENHYKGIKKNNPDELKKVIDSKTQIGFKKKYRSHIIGSSIILIFLIFFFIKNYNPRDLGNCIIWKETHFEKSVCTVKGAISNSVYNIDIENFKKTIVYLSRNLL